MTSQGYSTQYFEFKVLNITENNAYWFLDRLPDINKYWLMEISYDNYILYFKLGKEDIDLAGKAVSKLIMLRKEEKSAKIIRSIEDQCVFILSEWDNKD